MGSVYSIKYRDTGGILEVSLKNPDGSAFDLTSYTVFKLHILLVDGNKLSRDMAVFGVPSNGVLRYTWLTTDFDAGNLVAKKPFEQQHRMEYEVRNAGGTLRRTFPTADYDELRVVEDIGQG